mgnify:CR=1 FL=1
MKEFLENAKGTSFNSVVVSPTYVSLAKETLKDTEIKVGSVVGFPLGFEDSETKIAEVKSLLDKGVDEIEVVVNLSYLKDKKYDLIGKEIEEIKKVMGDKTLKLNIEVKALEDAEKSAVVQVAEKAGAEYIYDAPFKDFIYDEMGKIIGAKYETKDGIKEIYSKLVADCTGIPAAARTKISSPRPRRRRQKHPRKSNRSRSSPSPSSPRKSRK